MTVTLHPFSFSRTESKISSVRPAINSQLSIPFRSAFLFASNIFALISSIPTTCLHFYSNTKTIHMHAFLIMIMLIFIKLIYIFTLASVRAKHPDPQNRSKTVVFSFTSARLATTLHNSSAPKLFKRKYVAGEISNDRFNNFSMIYFCPHNNSASIGLPIQSAKDLKINIMIETKILFTIY